MKTKIIKILFLPILVIKSALYYFFKIFPYSVRRTFIQNEEVVKADLIRRIVKKYDYKILIETGTYLGSTTILFFEQEHRNK